MALHTMHFIQVHNKFTCCMLKYYIDTLPLYVYVNSQAVKDCTLSTAISLWRIVSVVQSCKLTTLDKVCDTH